MGLLVEDVVDVGLRDGAALDHDGYEGPDGVEDCQAHDADDEPFVAALVGDAQEGGADRQLDEAHEDEDHGLGHVVQHHAGRVVVGRDVSNVSSCRAWFSKDPRSLVGSEYLP